MNLVQSMMFATYQSQLGFDETVIALTESAKKNGWDIPMTYDLQEGYREAGYEDMSKVKLIYFCNPHGGYRILQDDENKPMSVMMPMGVSVYETNSGDVLVSGMNLERMSMMFGGTVKEVLQEGAANYARSFEGFASPAEPDGETAVSPKKVALGCLSITAVLGALIALLAAVASKVMPKIMANMMPKMMAAMEESGVQPPCAKIIIDHLEDKEEG